MRWLVALVLNTGLRFAEAAGLLKSDIVLDTETPFVRVRALPWRAVKTSGSGKSSTAY
jgi:integrase